ncbi:YdcF family protein [Paenibacillus sp. P96]|uniref:YdcF family protein n=1 Tax=Paenibacillus zeirhizosphaerae TaxID=2987519 RepID=A0ABT9FU35_9BACL|nr:YdcF family protein [Paenibacillus sp. P96]MDP4098256.1 YdcF family protein [Paenibacillus sp. P96]
MIYLIKFVYSFVLPPGLFVLLLLALAVWLWRWKRERAAAGILLAITLLLYCSSTNLIGDTLMAGLENNYPQPASVQGDVIVVLGGGAAAGTPDVDGSGNMFGSAANRLITAVRLHEQAGLPILFSGGQVFADSGNEGNIARRQLLGMGVPDSSILIENRSLNTEQNAQYTAALLQEKGLSRPVLVTSGFHMNRAVLQFEKAGIRVQPYPTDYLVSRPIKMYAGRLSPSAGALSNTGLALKEYLGILAAKLD